MSDPQINIEIEDVLASIRRLVSEGDTSPEARRKDTDADSKRSTAKQATIEVPVAAPATSANTPTPPERLVLSPDLLVEAPAPEPDEPETSAKEETTPLILTSPDRVEPEPQVKEDTLSRLGQTDAFIRPSPADMWHLSHQEEGDDLWSEDEADPLEEAMAESHATPRDARSQLLSTIAELEAAVTSTTDDFEPDGSERTPVVDWEKTTANGAIFGAQAATTRISDVAASPAEAEAQEGAESQSNVLEAPEPRVDRPLADYDDDSLDDEALSEFLNAETAMDEAALRELVTDIVRQELQGALGERITRNVRKLVRREIYRALASEEFN